MKKTAILIATIAAALFTVSANAASPVKQPLSGFTLDMGSVNLNGTDTAEMGVGFRSFDDDNEYQRFQPDYGWNLSVRTARTNGYLDTSKATPQYVRTDLQEFLATREIGAFLTDTVRAKINLGVGYCVYSQFGNSGQSRIFFANSVGVEKIFKGANLGIEFSQAEGISGVGMLGMVTINVAQ